MIKYRRHLNELLPKNPVTVELGVAEGYFSADILREWGSSLHYLVDNWGPIGTRGDGSFPQEWHNKNYHAAMHNIFPFKERARILRGPTTAMSQYVGDSTVDLVYVDACHWYDCVVEDIKAWWPKLKPGGVMAFHDWSDPAYGVQQAVTEFANAKGLKINFIPEDKVEDSGVWIQKSN